MNQTWEISRKKRRNEGEKEGGKEEGGRAGAGRRLEPGRAASGVRSPWQCRAQPEFVQVAEPHPPHTPLGAPRRSLTGQEPEEEETRKSRHGDQSSSASLVVGKAFCLPPPSTTGILREGSHPIWRLRTTSADPQSPPLPSAPHLGWVSHAMLSSRVGRWAACSTTGQRSGASWVCV